MDRGNGMISRVGQENRVAVGGTDGDGEAGKVGNQRVAFPEDARTVSPKYQIRMDLFHTGNRIGTGGWDSGAEAMGSPGVGGEARGVQKSWHLFIL